MQSDYYVFIKHYLETHQEELQTPYDCVVTLFKLLLHFCVMFHPIYTTDKNAFKAFAYITDTLPHKLESFEEEFKGIED